MPLDLKRYVVIGTTPGDELDGKEPQVWFSSMSASEALEARNSFRADGNECEFAEVMYSAPAPVNLKHDNGSRFTRQRPKAGRTGRSGKR